MKGCTPLPPPSAVLRDPAVDLLRFIGISMIFLAHIGPPAALFQLRSFDVPLMIFVSGLSYSGRQVVGYASFVRKRLGRLLIPLYLFLTVYFLVMWLLSECGVVEWFAARKVVGTYLLRLKPSINYVWIFRVFLIVMLLTPPLLRLERAVRDDRGFIALLAALFGLQALLTGWLKPLHLGFLVDDWLLYAVGTWLRMQPYKYPPRVYFLLWGTTVSLLLWSLRKYWSPLLACRPALFIGRNTIWLYLWHIPFARLIKTSMTDVWWGFRFLLIYAIALMLCLIQSRIVGMCEKRYGSKFLKYLKD